MILPILTASLLFNYDNFLFDLDGVVRNKDGFLPSSIRLINFLHEQGKNIVFLSNNNWRSPEDRAKQFRKQGMTYVEKNAFIIPIMVAVDYLKENGYYNSKIYALIPPYSQDRLRTELNATLIEDNPRIINEWNYTELHETLEKSIPDVVILDTYDQWTLESMTKCINWVHNKNVKFLILGPDTHFIEIHDIIIPDVGAFKLGIEKVSGRKAEIMGKPSPALNAYMANTRKFDPERTIIFGDNLYTDIATARENGFDSALVLTGVSSMKDVDKAVEENCNCIPTFLANFTSIMSDLEKWR